MTALRSRWKNFAVGVGLFMLFPTAWLIQPFVLKHDIPICFFRAATGHPCPLCGLTHALVCATHGDFIAATHFHRFWWLASLAIVVAGVWYLSKGFRATREPVNTRQFLR